MIFIDKLKGVLNFSSSPDKPNIDFLHRSFLAIASLACIVLIPFAINNLFQGHLALAIGTFTIIIILAFNTWTIRRQGRYYSMLTFVVLVPAFLLILSLAIINQGIIGVFWCYPAAVACYFTLPERKAQLANIALLIVTVPLAWNIIEQAYAVRMLATLSLVSILAGIFIRVITEQQTKLRTLAVTDSLTGLLDRTLLQNTLEEILSLRKRIGLPMSLLALDIDHFKKINDSYGHDAGDEVLIELGKMLQKRMRRIDKIFRLGGEEFLVILYGTDLDNAIKVAEELRKMIEAQPLIPNHPVTVSIGVSTLQEEEDSMTWMKRGDENLYKAKSSGRNRVVADTVSSEESSTT